MHKYNKIILVFMLLGLLVLSSCAGPNTLTNSAGSDGTVAGFWNGLWHGIILPFAFIYSFFVDNVNIYEIHNNGAWYNFGYLIGIGLTFGGGAKSTGKTANCK